MHTNENPALVLSVSLLSSNNYHSWPYPMIMALRSKNKLHFINGNFHRPLDEDHNSISWDRCNTMIMSWIHNSVEFEITQIILYMDGCCFWNMEWIEGSFLPGRYVQNFWYSERKLQFETRWFFHFFLLYKKNYGNIWTSFIHFLRVVVILLIKLLPKFMHIKMVIRLLDFSKALIINIQLSYHKSC